MTNFLKDPLAHFLAIGLCLFILSSLFLSQEPLDDPTTIAVNRDTLLRFMQYRAKTFDRERFNEQFDTLSKDQKKALIDQYVQEGSLYREGKALRLDSNDYTARQRLIQQVSYITRGFIDREIDGDKQQVEHFYDENIDNYAVPEKITFTHVFSVQRRSV